MKIDKIIFAADDSYFLDFWPIQSKICKEVLNIEPVLFRITEDDSEFYNDGNGLVKHIKKIKGINTGAQAAIGRMFFTKYFPNDVCAVSDIDLLVINKNYLQNSIKNFEEDSFVIYVSDAYDENRTEAKEYVNQEFFEKNIGQLYPYFLNVGKGKTFNKILDTDCSFSEYLYKHKELGNKTLFWGVDECYFSKCVNKKNHEVKIEKLIRGYESPWKCSGRIERHRFDVQLEFINEINSQKNEGIYDFKNLKKDNIIEINLPRPYNRYKDEIDNVVNLILEKEKNMKKKEKIKELLLTPRMFYADYGIRHNQLKGLKMLIDEYLNDNSVMVEIGSFAGVSSELFALHCKELHCVDLWDPYWEITDKQRIEFAEFSFDKMSKNYENIYKVKKNSVEASKDFKDGSLDLVYIDAAHDYDSVKQDILTWLPKIKKGGFIAGHDYRYDPNIGVYEAVNDIFVNDYKIISFPDSSFIITV